MANPMSMTILLLVVLTALAAVVQVTEAVNYVVGDSAGWARPSTLTYYTTWANGKNFSLGDVLGKLPYMFKTPNSTRAFHKFYWVLIDLGLFQFICINSIILDTIKFSIEPF